MMVRAILHFKAGGQAGSVKIILESVRRISQDTTIVAISNMDLTPPFSVASFSFALLDC